MSSIVTSRDAIKALSAAIRAKDTISVRSIAQEFSSHFSSTVKRNILAEPARLGHPETLSVLLDVWKDMPESDIEYAHSCAYNAKQTETFTLLLSYIKDPERLGFSLVCAAEAKKHAFVSALLENCNELITPKHKESALITLFHGDPSDLVQMLLRHANADISAAKKGIALYNSSLIGNNKTINVLLDYCSNEIEGKYKGSALRNAVTYWHHETVCTLLDRCKDDISIDDYSVALWTAVRSNNIKSLTLLIEHANKHFSPADKELALSCAIFHNYYECADSLIKHCLPDLSDKAKIAIGVLAVRQNNKPILELLSKNADFVKVANSTMHRVQQELLAYSGKAIDAASNAPMEIIESPVFTPRFTVTDNKRSRAELESEKENPRRLKTRAR